jgi:hypothetical protein
LPVYGKNFGPFIFCGRGTAAGVTPVIVADATGLLIVAHRLARDYFGDYFQ